MVCLNDEPYAIYQVHWTINQVFKHGAEFYLILGQFGDGTTAADRFAFALHFFIDSDRSGFMVVDADKTSISSQPLIGRALPRVDVINTPLAEEVFELVDAIWLDDENIAEVSNYLPEIHPRPIYLTGCHSYPLLWPGTSTCFHRLCLQSLPWTRSVP